MNLSWMAETFNKDTRELNETIAYLNSLGFYEEKVQEEMVEKGILGPREQNAFLKEKYLSKEVAE